MGGLATKRVRAVLQLLGLAGARWKRVVFPLRSERKAFQSQRFPLDGVELAVLLMSKPTLTGVVEPIRRCGCQ